MASCSSFRYHRCDWSLIGTVSSWEHTSDQHSSWALAISYSTEDSQWNSLQSMHRWSHLLNRHPTHQLGGCSWLLSRWCLGSRSRCAKCGLLRAHFRVRPYRGKLDRNGPLRLCSILLPCDGRNEGPLRAQPNICQIYAQGGEILFGDSQGVASFEDQTFLKYDYSRPSKAESMERQQDAVTHLAHPI